MNVSDMISEIGDWGFTDVSTTRIVAEINDTIWDVCSREPWTFLEKSIDLTFDGISAIPTNWPADFRAVLGLGVIGFTGGLDYVNLEDVDKDYAHLVDTVGTPTAFFFQNGTLHILPIPTSDVVVRMRYLQRPVAVTDSTLEADIVIPHMHHHVAIFGTLAKLYDMEDDELAARMDGRFERRLATMSDELDKLQYDQTETIRIQDGYDDDSYWGY